MIWLCYMISSMRLVAFQRFVTSGGNLTGTPPIEALPTEKVPNFLSTQCFPTPGRLGLTAIAGLKLGEAKHVDIRAGRPNTQAPVLL